MNEVEWLVCSNPNLMLDSLKGNVTSRKLGLFACACCRRIWHLLIDNRSRIAVEKSELYADHLINTTELEIAWDAANKAKSALATRRAQQRHALQDVIRRIWDLGSKEQTLNQGNDNEVPDNARLLWGTLLAVLAPECQARWLESLDKSIETFNGGQETISQLEALRTALESKQEVALMKAVEEYRKASSWSWGAAAASRVASATQTEEQVVYPARTVAKYAAAATSFVFPSPPGKSESESQCSLLREIVGNPFRPAVIDRAWVKWNAGVVFQAAKALYDKRQVDEMARFGDLLRTAGCDSEDILSHCWSKEPHTRGCWVLDLILGID